MADGYNVKQGDQGYTNTTTLLDRDGNPVNLAGATVRFHMIRKDQTSAVIDEPADIVDEATGKVRYWYTSAQTASTGLYDVEYEVTFSDTSVQTFPSNGNIKFRIHDDVA